MKQITVIALLCLLLPSLVQSDDSRYQQVRDKLFWPKLYNTAYQTLYCGLSKHAGEKVTVEHVYPASWMARAYGCQNRKQCNNPQYKQASADLHNLWPALNRYNSSRGNQPYGEIQGNTPRFKQDNCDYERTTGKLAVIEPRDNVKGDIARSFLYMMYKYKLPDHSILPLMVKWHQQDPPSEEEKRRNLIIEGLQGERNPLIN